MSVGLTVEFTPLAGAGCTDMAACNYDETASVDDGTCTYAAAGFDCEGNCLEGTFTTIDVQEISTGGFTYTLVGYGGSWSLTDLSTGESAAATSSDNVSDCLAGCLCAPPYGSGIISSIILKFLQSLDVNFNVFAAS